LKTRRDVSDQPMDELGVAAFFIQNMINAISQRKKDKILGIHGELLSAKDLKPSERINAVFSELVGMVQDTPGAHSKDILNDKEIRLIKDDLRRMSSKAESELELFWVKNALKSADAQKILSIFPYYLNYDKMTDLEIESMRLCNVHGDHKALFVGSGPLPLSSIMMARKCGISIDNLDMDDEACALSKELIERVGLLKKIGTIKGNILDMQDLSGYQTIFIAALAGESEHEKARIIDHVVARSERDTHIVMRSVSDLGTLLYPEITPLHLKDIEVIRRSESPRDIINNIIIGKKK
jgi:nicotianamine synthase